MKKLFVIYIGGSCEGALIELHDIRLIISDSIENTYDALKKSWWGTAQSLHIDAWGILNWADGYKIEIVDASTTSQDIEKLYFVNLGGYDSKQFTELHKNIFVVARNEQGAKDKAVSSVAEWEMPHKDRLFDVDKILDVSNLLNHRIKLTPCAEGHAFEFVCKYTPFGKA
jgi:hypothetical protein